MSIFYCQRQRSLFGNHQPFQNSIKITQNLGGIEIDTPFNKEFVEQLKIRVPFQFRGWDNDLKVWRVASNYARTACELVEEIYGYCPEINLDAEDNAFESQTYLVEYIGRAKKRDEDGESIAMGYCQNNWNIIFPEKVLRTWFDGKDYEEEKDEEAKPKTPKTLTYYQLLGVKQAVEQAAVKKAYYRMAKQWHPDVCKESDARERFEAINNAYKILSEPMLRKRYDAGLAFEKEAKKQIRQQQYNQSKRSQVKAGLSANYGYAPPLRCGVITMDGEYAIGKILVTKIHGWEDWTENGKTAVASWNMATMSIETIWV